MIPIVHWYTLGNPLPNILGSYNKTTTFVIGNNVGPLDDLINMGFAPFSIINIVVL
jgi:hypothetical protein